MCVKLHWCDWGRGGAWVAFFTDGAILVEVCWGGGEGGDSVAAFVTIISDKVYILPIRFIQGDVR